MDTLRRLQVARISLGLDTQNNWRWACNNTKFSNNHSPPAATLTHSLTQRSDEIFSMPSQLK